EPTARRGRRQPRAGGRRGPGRHTMAIRRLKPAVLYVRDAARSAAFYRDVLGFRDVHTFPGGAFLQAPDSTNDHDIAFFSIGEGARPSPAGAGGAVGLYHVAWEGGTAHERVDPL